MTRIVRFDNSFKLCVLLLSIILTLILFVYSQRIEFHADEAIYFAGIPLAMRADTGLVFNFAYYPAFTAQSLELARLISCLFGAGIFASVALLPIEGKKQRVVFCAGAFLLFAVSYPAAFSSARVRPEISWLFTATVTLSALAWYVSGGKRWSAAIAVCFAFLTGMNHKLSWLALLFICLFCAAEIVRKRRFDPWLIAVAGAACAGPIVNQLARAWLLDANIIDSLRMMASSPAVERSSLGAFVTMLLRDSAIFLGDYAATPTLFQKWFGKGSPYLTDHFLSNAYIAVACILPFLAKRYYQLVIFSLPAYFLLLFWALGYFNPTYAPFISQFAALALLYIATVEARSSLMYRVTRYAATVLVGLFVLIGVSFLGTRVFAYGKAGTFALHDMVENELGKLALAGASNFALPERFQNAAPHGAAKVQVLFKDDIDPAVDAVVYDEYDRLMYTFVSDYAAKRAQIEATIAKLCPVIVNDYLVYPGGKSFPDFSQRNGSWFFRHSVGSTLRIFRRCG